MMTLDNIYQAFSSTVQGINNIGTSLASFVSLITKGTASFIASMTVTSLPSVNVNPYPFGADPFVGSSGNVAAATATATITSSGGLLAYIAGFRVTSAGATGASVVNLTITGIKGGTMTFAYASVAGATVGNTPFGIDFPYPIPASSAGVSIAVSLPSLGAGNTNASIVAYGYRI